MIDKKVNRFTLSTRYALAVEVPYRYTFREAKGVAVVERILKNKIFSRYQGNWEMLEGSVLKYMTDNISQLTQRTAKRLFFKG